MTKNLVLIALICFQQSTCEEVRLLDLEPNDAENIISKQDQSLNYAPKIDHDVPAVRYLGEEPHNVLEDIYLAKQYHGQDGLGGYLYGYQVPDISKNEEKKASGDLKGAYNYINGAGQEIKVEYWDNGNGFHQKDNIPQILPQQIDDSPAVKEAKEAFLKRWNEEAERNTHPIQSPYNSEGQYASGPLAPQGQQQYQGAASGPQGVYAKQAGGKEEEQDAEGAYNPENDNEGKYVPDENDGPTGPPKGFFYAFDYPVGIITQDQGRALPVEKNLKNVYEENKQRFERQLEKGGSSSGGQYLIN